MGLFAFLTASRLKAELTRQRDEIARLHQSYDLEVAQKQEADKQARLLEKRLNELASSLQQSENRIKELEGEKQSLEADLNKIMGNLNRW